MRKTLATAATVAAIATISACSTSHPRRRATSSILSHRHRHCHQPPPRRHQHRATASTGQSTADHHHRRRPDLPRQPSTTARCTQDFKKMLPVTLPWFRNAGIENITELASPTDRDRPVLHRRTTRRPSSTTTRRDSITIIYAPTSSVPTLTKMGEITSDLDAFENLPDNVDMRIEAG